MTVLDQHTLVAALLDVPGVLTAAHEPTGVGPGTLRLQLRPGADEVDVAGAVNRLLRSGFGLAVEAERVRVLHAGLFPEQSRGHAQGRAADDVSGAPDPTAAVEAAEVVEVEVESVVVEVESAKVGAAEQEPVPRLLLERVEHVSLGLGVVVSVTLTSGVRSVLGQAEGAATTSAHHRTVAAPTLRAVEKVVTRQVRLDVEHVDIGSTGGGHTALVVLSMLSDRDTQRLSGSSIVTDDTHQAIVRAVLAAVNRRIEPMLA